ncbi:MAG: hypothetical protein FJ241_11885 [Nitrospira sp.]|nr:hypothetical protein [Nitrospira sp.]
MTKLNKPDLLQKILGFDPSGEIFIYKGRLLRGIFPGHGAIVQKLLEKYRRHKLWNLGIVKTDLVVDPELSHLGYDMVLEHEKFPFITYAHEWTPGMLKEAALFQINLNRQLLDFGMLLKDCGVSSNVLFKFTEPVFVDFLSLISTDDLTKEEWLKPASVRSPFQLSSSEPSRYFNEIFYRMFYPCMLYPLYMMAQGRHDQARKRLFKTALNTTTDTITEQEAFAGSHASLTSYYRQALTAREQALAKDDWHQFMDILRQEIESLPVTMERSRYSDYYALKGEDFEFTPSEAWKAKQHAVYRALQSLHPDTVFDVGANTGWYSILAAKMGCKVVAIDNDHACMDILYQRARNENLPILPLVMDLMEITPDVPAWSGFADDPHILNSRIKGETPLLLAAQKRLKCDLVLSLAMIHHLTLGMGMDFETAIGLLASFSEKYLLLEFVVKEDPLIVGEPDFFKAYFHNPHAFDWYTQQGCHQVLLRHYDKVEFVDLTGSRVLFVCSQKKGTA